jgi:pSer/pThr/pTyr-binding forkhead associated (FHA) protein
MMRITLEIVDGPFAGRKKALRCPAVFKVGRTELADYAIPIDPRMSSVHFGLQCDQTSLRIRDLNSTNGTFVNGHRIVETELADGDLIKAGETTLKVHIASTPRSTEIDATRTAKESLGKPTARGTDANADSSTITGIGDTLPAPPLSDMENSATSASSPTPQHDSGAEPTREMPVASQPGPTVPSESPPSRPPASRSSAQDAKARPHGVMLEIQSESSGGRTLWLRSGQELTVGRTEEADVSLTSDPKLSSVHFAVAYHADRCVLRDLGSANGTMVNGAPARQVELVDGDQIVAGDTKFVVRVADQGSTFGQGIRDSTAAMPGGDASRPYQAALRDEDPRVRTEALHAAVWTRQPWLLEHCRQASSEPIPENAEALLLLAILGQPIDLPRIRRIGQAAGLGPFRYRVLGAFGHPQMMDEILAGLGPEDARRAVAAAAAFTKITGVDIESDERVTLPPEDGSEPDEFEREFLEEVKLPDPKLAEQHWNKVKEQFRKGTRWCRGFDFSQTAGPDDLPELDMESRWEAGLRGKYHGTWNGSLRDLQRFPQAFRTTG